MVYKICRKLKIRIGIYHQNVSKVLLSILMVYYIQSNKADAA